jgi:LPS-assembly protein
MTVQAVEVDYDYNNQRVSAVGNVQMFYNGTSVEADKVIFDQKTKRLHAEGNIRLTDADGKVTYANIMSRCSTPSRSRASTRARRDGRRSGRPTR